MTCPLFTRYRKENYFRVELHFLFWIKVHILLVITKEMWHKSLILSWVLHFFALPEFESFVIHINIEMYKVHSKPEWYISISSSLQSLSLRSLLVFFFMFIHLFGYFIATIHGPLCLHYFFSSGMIFYSFLFFMFDWCSEMLKWRNLFFNEKIFRNERIQNNQKILSWWCTYAPLLSTVVYSFW